MLFKRIEEILGNLPGQIGLYYKDLKTGEKYEFNGQDKFNAASVIKLPLLVAVIKAIYDGELDREHTVKVASKDKVPGCGVLSLMHTGVEVNVLDLCNLMIVISDNTATNMLIDVLGLERIKETFDGLGLKKTVLTRHIFDMEAKKKGLDNFICPSEIGMLLEGIYKGGVISPEASEEIADILRQQQLNSKIPYLLPPNVPVGHKTGEISGVTHDVGIVYGENPFVLCFASEDTEVVLAEDAMRRIALLFYQSQA